MDKKTRPIPSSFSVEVFNLQPTDNPMISRARMATFYKGANRNLSFFTDEVTNMVLNGAPGSPVCGTFDRERMDFSIHMPPEVAQNYGHVPESPNFAWEKRLDPDGIEREYACFDVLLWTGRHPEAKLIPGKGQSMELDPKSISGSWYVYEGQEYFKYDNARISGFCVLGDEFDPCFPSAHFSKAEETNNNAERWNEYLLASRQAIVENFKLTTKEQEKGGKSPMKLNFGAGREKLFEVFTLLNPNFTEEAGFIVDVMPLVETAENTYAVYSFADHKQMICSLSTNEEGATEFALADVEIPTVYSEEQYNAVVEERDTLSASVTTITTERDSFAQQVTDATTSLEAANSRIAELEPIATSYAQLEDARKEELLSKYSELLPEETIKSFEASKETMSSEQLESKLAVNFMRSNDATKSSAGTKKIVNPTSTETPGNELVNLLARYKK